MDAASKFLVEFESDYMTKKSLCETFEFPQLVKVPLEQLTEMRQDLREMQSLWEVMDTVDAYVEECRGMLWSEMSMDELDDGSKAMVKKVKSLHKCTRWSPASKLASKKAVDFLNTVPLIQLLAAPCMRDRHWTQLKTATGKEFTPPYLDKNLKLGEIIALQLHEFSGDVEDICDASSKELKIENTVTAIAERWKAIDWLMDLYADSDVPLLKIGEEDFEALEADQLTVQGMLASRFVKIFEAEVLEWQTRLAFVADVFMCIGEIQRTWSYLEPLFIHSEEVKKELPEDATRFKGTFSVRVSYSRRLLCHDVVIFYIEWCIKKPC